MTSITPSFEGSNMLFKFSAFVLALGVSLPAWAQVREGKSPRLIVLIMVDQMRADLLGRFASAMRASNSGREEGLLQLQTTGSVFLQARTASAPSVTAAGHATLCTGTTPARHGVVGNSLYDRESKRNVEATFDPQARLVSTKQLLASDPLSNSPDEGKSARLRKTGSLSDVMHSLSGGGARTLSISLKDRGAIFCAGAGSSGTYWYEAKSGSMVSSTAFTPALPAWVDAFNLKSSQRAPQPWRPLFSIAQMQAYLVDPALRSALTVRSSFSQRFGAGFPYEMAASKGIGGRSFFELTPAANDFLVDFAIEGVRQERLGCASRSPVKTCRRGTFPDLLTVSFSTPDLVGHSFGGESPELMDVYVKLNKSVARLMRELDVRFGRQSVLYVVSSDHGVQTLPEVLRSRGVELGKLDKDEIMAAAESALRARFGEGQWIEAISTSEVYLRASTLEKFRVSRGDVASVLSNALTKIGGVRGVLSEADFTNAKTPEAGLFARGHDPQRSGDLKILTHAGWLWGSYVAANHGTAFDEDTRIPIIFSGWKIPRGKTINKDVFADDVVPTLLGILGHAAPTWMTGRSLEPEMML
jgi:hypothetical protein